MTHSEIRESLPGLVLGALTGPEETEVRSHLQVCAACRQDAVRLDAAVAAMAIGVELVEPPPGFRERVLRAARHSSLVPLPFRESRLNAPHAGRRRAPQVALAAAAVLLVGLAGWNLGLQGRAPSGVRSPETQRTVALIGPHGTRAGQVMFARGGAGTTLVQFEALSSPGEGRVYQLWVIRNNHPLPQQTFLPNADGGKLLALTEVLVGNETIAVTLEPAGGSQQPTTAPIIVGHL